MRRSEQAAYDPIARFYDLDHQDFDDDISMYLNFARASQSPLLDIGVGTGRVAIALAKARYPVTGIDVSQAMLALARERLHHEGLVDQVALIHADVCTLESASRFGFAYFALNTFTHLLDQADQMRALRTLWHHLLPGARLLIDQWNPLSSEAPDASGQWLLGYRQRSSWGTWVTQSVATVADPGQQLLTTTMIYDEEIVRHQRERPLPVTGSSIRRTTLAFKLRYHYCFEVQWLLLAAGFETEATFGDYDLGPYRGASPRLITLAKRVGS
ncbi:MAG: class I SAM-dependent methyltransferase [Chloroflexi bacterium]|nr:class I SAM-dependent methyltransferase [Chloroflexota bacterium]